jgi:hypothetical protein
VLSQLWQTAIGAGAAIGGGLIAAVWQTSRADKVAQSIRRAERRERGLLELNAKIADALAQLDSLYKQVAASGQGAWQYQQAVTLLSNLTHYWDSEAAGVIPDYAVSSAYDFMQAAIRGGLPAGARYADYLGQLQGGSEEVNTRFSEDLRLILERVRRFKSVVQDQVRDLQGREPWTRRLLNAVRMRRMRWYREHYR